jgi:hypothetical protein
MDPKVTIPFVLFEQSDNDGELIEVQATGLRHGPVQILERIATGKPTSPGEYYFRVSVVFHAPTGHYDWMNRAIFIGIGERMQHAVRIRVYRVQ